MKGKLAQERGRFEIERWCRPSREQGPLGLSFVLDADGIEVRVRGVLDEPPSRIVAPAGGRGGHCCDASAAAVDADDGFALSAAREPAIEEVDPPNDSRTARQGDDAAAEISGEGESPSRGEGLAVGEGDADVEQLQVAALHQEADVPEPALAGSPDDIALSPGAYHTSAEVNPCLLDDEHDHDEGAALPGSLLSAALT